MRVRGRVVGRASEVLAACGRLMMVQPVDAANVHLSPGCPLAGTIRFWRGRTHLGVAFSGLLNRGLTLVPAVCIGSK